MTESFFKNESDEQPRNEIIDIDTEKLSNEEFRESFQSEEGRMAAILSYIPLLCFIPLLNMKDNKDARFHARQGVLLFLIELLAFIFHCCFSALEKEEIGLLNESLLTKERYKSSGSHIRILNEKRENSY